MENPNEELQQRLEAIYAKLLLLNEFSLAFGVEDENDWLTDEELAAIRYAFGINERTVV